MIEFTGYILQFLNDILSFTLIPGISIKALLFYSMLLVWTATIMLRR